LQLLKKAIDKAYRIGSSLCVCSVDISAAFDSVVQSQVFLKIRQCGVNAHVVALLSLWYSGSFAKVKVTLADRIDLFEVNRQGSVLSPILFKTLPSAITKDVTGGFSINLCDLSLLRCANDLLMLSSNVTSLQQNIDRLIAGYKSIGLRDNALKTEYGEFCPSESKQRINGRTYVTVEQMDFFPGNTMK